MADHPTKMSKNLMNSPYYQSYSSGRGNNSAARSSRQFVPAQAKGKVAANYNQRIASGRMRGGNNGGLPSNSRPVVAAGDVGPAPQYTAKQLRKMQKQRRREKSYFFVMRKGVCFFMFVFFALIVAVLALSFLNILPNYTSLHATKVDNTTLAAREEYQMGVDADGNYLIYEDTTEYVSVSDPIYGILKDIAGLEMNNEDGTSKSADYDATLAGLKEAATSDNQAVADDSMFSIALIIYEYYPIGLVVIAVTALIAMFTSFFGMFGKRIFKGFGLAAILILVFSVVTLLAGLISLGYASGAPMYDVDGNLISVLDFSNIGSYLLRLVTGAPATDADVAAAPVVAGGFGLLVLLVGSLITLILSIFARRKLPYSIFDK